MTPIQKLTASLIAVVGISGAAVSDAIVFDTILCTITDTKTGLTCSEVSENPEQDVYYIVDEAYIEDEDLFEMAHQDPATVRWNLAHTAFILKFDASELPRDLVGAQQGLHDPMSNEEILEVIQGDEWSEDDGEIVKEDPKKDFAVDDNFIEP